MTTLKVATVGAGYFAGFHHEAWARMKNVALVAVCDTALDRAEAMARDHGAPAAYDDPEKMLTTERPDLLDIAVPPAGHRALVALAARHGVHAICQKAFTRSLAEAQEAVALAKAAGITLAIHENFRFQPWYREAKRLITAGHLGEIFGAHFRLRPGDGKGPRAYLDRQPYFQTMERFLIHETGIHFIDTFRFLFGEARDVFADLRQLNPAINGEDAGLLLLTHGAGIKTLFDGNRLADHAAENRRLTMGEFTVEGSAGTLRLDGNGRLFVRPFGTNDDTPHTYAWSAKGFAGDCVFALQRHVVDHLIDGAPLENSGEDYLQNLRVEAAAYQSAKAGARVKV
ncbi:MAG: Gfo/Idh/MocA family oxidoreductase [Pseudomonadota bacterium]